MSEWEVCKLKDLNCLIQTGYAFKSDSFSSTGIPIIKIGNIQNKRVLITNSENFFPWSFLTAKISDYFLINGDILIAMTGQGSVGRVGKVLLRDDQKALLNQRVGRFLCDEIRLNKEYLFYVLTSELYQSYLFSAGIGSGQPNLSPEIILETQIPAPPYPSQKAIAAVLSSLDDKIDLLHRQNQTLEALAQTLFRQWFIEEARPGWEEGVLPNEFDFVMGQSPLGTSFNQNGIGLPLFQGNADFGFRFPTERVFTTMPTRYAQKFDTLISVRAPVGAQNMAEKVCCIGRGVASFRYKYNHSFYTYTYFKLHSLLTEIKQFNDAGTVFGSISKSDFESLIITIPPKKVIFHFEESVKPINDKIIANCYQIRTLENLRDTLLPKLMSGEVRVAL